MRITYSRAVNHRKINHFKSHFTLQRGVSNLGAGFQGLPHRANHLPPLASICSSAHSLLPNCPSAWSFFFFPLFKLQLSRVPEEIGRSVQLQWPPRLFFSFFFLLAAERLCWSRGQLLGRSRAREEFPFFFSPTLNSPPDKSRLRKRTSCVWRPQSLKSLKQRYKSRRR